MSVSPRLRCCWPGWVLWPAPSVSAATEGCWRQVLRVTLWVWGGVTPAACWPLWVWPVWVWVWPVCVVSVCWWSGSTRRCAALPSRDWWHDITSVGGTTPVVTTQYYGSLVQHADTTQPPALLHPPPPPLPRGQEGQGGAGSEAGGQQAVGTVPSHRHWNGDHQVWPVRGVKDMQESDM